MMISRETGSLISGTATWGGFVVDSISRWCIPDEDRAQFHVKTGTISGQQVDMDLDSGGIRVSGSIIPGTNFTNLAVRIQVYDDESFPGKATAVPTSGWKTVFLGTVIYTENTRSVGLDEYGTTTVYCAGILTRTRCWPMNRHSTVDNIHAIGNPGYNIPLHGYFRQVIGNRASNGAPGTDPYGDMAGKLDVQGRDFSDYYFKHALPTDATGYKWTDMDVVRHALTSSRAVGEPLISVSMEGGLFDGTYSWPVSPSETCWDVIRRICNRGRGRGACFMNYQDNMDGSVTPILVANRPNLEDIYYYSQGTTDKLQMLTSHKIDKAVSGVDAVDVDINNDHRVTDDGFRFDNRESAVSDCVVVQGEPIQVLTNLSFNDGGPSLVKAWSNADETAFETIDIKNTRWATSARWRHVYRRFRIDPYAMLDTYANNPQTINFRTDQFGNVVRVEGGEGGSSAMTVRVLPDLPIYEGWRYDIVPPDRWDGGSDYLPPARMPPVVIYKTKDTGTTTWFPLTQYGFSIQSDDFGVLICHSAEDVSGFRFLISNPASKWFASLRKAGVPITAADTSSGIVLDNLKVIAGVELGARVSISKSLTGTYLTNGRRMTMTVNGVHLWLGAPGMIWDMDLLNAAQSGYTPGLTFPSGVIANLIRDDRAELSFIAALAYEYYGKVHNPSTWTLRDCGLLTSFSTLEGATIAYPTLGQIVGNVTFAGPQNLETTVAINTPITSIHYDHEQGTTTWRTDYVSYDGNMQ
jgi:hypothetical protein